MEILFNGDDSRLSCPKYKNCQLPTRLNGLRDGAIVRCGRCNRCYVLRFYDNGAFSIWRQVMWYHFSMKKKIKLLDEDNKTGEHSEGS